jgi:hypothetical protein
VEEKVATRLAWRRLWPMLFVGIVFGVGGTRAQSERCMQAECLQYQTPGCAHHIDDLPDCGPQVAYYYRQTVSIDDDGRYGAGDCDGAPCENVIRFDVPDQSLDYEAVWIRMHDHEEDVRFRIRYINDGHLERVDGEWDVQTSGACKEPCSMNTARYHPPGDEGCPTVGLPVPGPPDVWFTEYLMDPRWADRDSWPCAISFNEHVVQMRQHGYPGAEQVRLRFTNDDAHIHVYDLVWVVCRDEATPTPWNTWTPTPPPTSTPTATPIPTDTPTSTPTATPTSTPTPTPTPTIEPVTEVRLAARYPRLVYYGPELGLPAQTLDVVVVGGTPPYDAVVYVVPPSGIYTPVDYTAGSNPWSYGPGESGNPYLGVEEAGTWLGRVVVDGTPSNIVSWEVHWYPAHVVR